MPSCTRPLYGRYDPAMDLKVVFNPSPKEIMTKAEVKIPCGRCIACRITLAQEWSIRCYHESKMHEENTFLTLTYDDTELPKYGSLNPIHFTRFIKSLRKHIKRDIDDRQIKFFGCGEYGDQTQRPHYHVLIFGYDFADKKLHSRSKNEQDLYSSERLSAIWKRGHAVIGNVSYESAGYVARYSLKKRFGVGAKLHYGKKTPEFLRMSRGGQNGKGIGYEYFFKYYSDFIPNDYCVINGRKHPIPRYYMSLIDDEVREHIRQIREENRNDENTHDRRLAAKEAILKQKQAEIKRDQI